MELNPGYKQTEAGVIPEDWSPIQIGEIFSFKNGLNKAKEFFGTGTPIVNYMDVFGHPGLHVSDLNGRVTLSKAEIDRFDVRTGDVFFTRTSETVEEIGTAAVMLDSPKATVFSGFVLRGRPTANHLEDAFKQYCFADASVRAQIVSTATYTTRALTNGRLLSSVWIALPPNSEQRVIATALSDVDALLEGLDRLIAKKCDLKQAAMQQLLPGKIRLPGFEGEWDTKRIGEFTDCTAGGTPSTAVPQYWGGTIRWMSSGELNLKKVHDVDGRITERGLRESSTKIVPPRCILIGLAGQGKTRGTVAMNTVELCTNQSIAAVFPNEHFSPEYLYYNLDTRYEELRSMSTGDGGRGGLNLRIIRSIKVPFPDVKEQNTIATVISDMDAEIKAIEQRRAKAADLKQAMMQELLTGKTRLVEPQVSDEQAKAALSNTKGHNWAINEAVVIATLTKHFGGEDYPLGRKRYTKLSYLLHRRVEQQTDGYLKKAAGPYNPQTKYGGPEKIAKQNRYIKQHKGPKGHSGFIAADNIAQAEGYFEKWYGPEAIQWLEQFRFKKNDDLELLATVDMAALELRASGKTVDVAAVKDVITSHPEWEAKLDRAAFSDANIAEAIKQSDALLGSEIAGGSHA